MGNPQLTYGTRATSLLGQRAYGLQQGFVQSRACESASIDFGLAVGEGSSDDEVVVGGTVPLGIALRDPANPMIDTTDDGQYLIYQDVSIIDKDIVWVTTASTSGSYGDTVVYNTTTGAITIGTPSTTTKAIGWLAQTVTAAGLMKIFVDSRMSVGAVVINGVAVDNTDLADTKILKYNATTENLEYEDDATA